MRPYTLESASDTNLLCLCLDITEDMAAKIGISVGKQASNLM